MANSRKILSNFIFTLQIFGLWPSETLQHFYPCLLCLGNWLLVIYYGHFCLKQQNNNFNLHNSLVLLMHFGNALMRTCFIIFHLNGKKLDEIIDCLNDTAKQSPMKPFTLERLHPARRNNNNSVFVSCCLLACWFIFSFNLFIFARSFVPYNRMHPFDEKKEGIGKEILLIFTLISDSSCFCLGFLLCLLEQLAAKFQILTQWLVDAEKHYKNNVENTSGIDELLRAYLYIKICVRKLDFNIQPSVTIAILLNFSIILFACYEISPKYLATKQIENGSHFFVKYLTPIYSIVIGSVSLFSLITMSTFLNSMAVLFYENIFNFRQENFLFANNNNNGAKMMLFLGSFNGKPISLHLFGLFPLKQEFFASVSLTF